MSSFIVVVVNDFATPASTTTTVGPTPDLAVVG
jgi:hypothetical protein